jgi:hypothetical protein
MMRDSDVSGVLMLKAQSGRVGERQFIVGPASDRTSSFSKHAPAKPETLRIAGG